MKIKQLEMVISQFNFEGDFIEVKPLGIGNINDSFVVEQSSGKYTLQKINTDIFKNPELVMNNITNITKHLRNKIKEEGGDPQREVLNFITTKNGEFTYVTKDNDFYRAYNYIDNVKTYQNSENTDTAYKVAKAFGIFQRRLADFDTELLFETIPDFHNTKKRLAVFEEIVTKDPIGRVKEVEDLVDFVRKESYLATQLTDALDKKVLPIRVSHNDTKINNILFDLKTNEGLCVIDLDTVMPSTALYDFGDMVRSGAATAEEDETDLSKVTIDLDYYKAFVKGFSEGVEGKLSPEEMSRLALSAKVITFELAIRFLGDYINGDVYFSIRRPLHNKERAANQLKLLADMEEKYQQMTDIDKACIKI